MSTITKQALEASLKQMMLKKPLDKITIRDITEACGISRMTFYYHFKDIYDLVEWVCVEDASRALQGKKTYDTWQEGFLHIFQYVLDNRAFVARTYHSLSREHLERYLYHEVYDLLWGVVEEKATGLSVREEDRAFIAHLYKYALVGLVLEWIGGGMKGEPREIIDRLELVIRGSIPQALERFSTRKI